MNAAAFPGATYPAPNRHSDGSINIEAYTAIAMTERRKELRRLWALIAIALTPGDGRPMVRGYTARLG
jgi:hypothetical protein